MESGVGPADEAGQKRIYQQYPDRGSCAYNVNWVSFGSVYCTVLRSVACTILAIVDDDLVESCVTFREVKTGR